MMRASLVTKETMKALYKGELRNDEPWMHYEGSMNDDLEDFFINLQNQEEMTEEEVVTFFLPKLSEEELKLVEKRNEEHLESYDHFLFDLDPDVDPDEMKKSNSRSKYVDTECCRRTLFLHPKKFQTSSSEMSISRKRKFIDLFKKE